MDYPASPSHHLVLGPGLDAGAVPGRPTAASFGLAHVGPAGFVSRLETALGLGGPALPDAARAAALVPALRATEGFWSGSVGADPLGVARELLRWRDVLVLHGWSGGAGGERLSALAAVTAGVPSGLGDRLRAIRDAIPARDPELARVTLVEPEARLPRMVRDVLAALRVRGTEVTVRAPECGVARGDLAAARAPGFCPVGDGSLRLLRPAGPLEAAEEVAAWLATGGGSRGAVVLGPDAVLDTALRRHGLPTTGGPDTDADALQQLLPLVLALGWSPTDPQRALELLTLPVSPIPRRVAVRLVSALQEWPAVDSDAWREALASALDAEEDEARRASMRARVATFLTGTVTGRAYPAAEARRRVDALLQWLRGREATDETGALDFGAAMAQVEGFRRLLDLSGIDPVPAPQLKRLVEDASAATSGPARFPAEAGFRTLSDPAGLVGPVERVVWWSFGTDSVPAPLRLPLSREERDALAASGVVLPPAATLALAAAERWRRPLLGATQELVLVCPVRGQDGEERHPHPLWDEIVAGMPTGVSASPLVQTSLPTSRPPTRRLALAAPVPRRRWTIPAESVTRRERESPSSLARFVGCSLQWALHYVAEVRSGATATLPEGTQLWGSLVHEIAARVLRTSPLPPPADAASAALVLFDVEGPRMAAPLFAPGAERDRARVRRITGLATAELARCLQEAGLTVEQVETEKVGTGCDGVLVGTPDLVAHGTDRVIVDLKWSGAKYRREELAAGCATQLAAYAHLLAGTTGAHPVVAYYILSEQRAITTEPDRFPGADPVEGALPAETWLRFERAWRSRWTEVAEGALEAPGNEGDNGEEAPESGVGEDGTLRLAPACRFCDFGNLCGKARCA